MTVAVNSPVVGNSFETLNPSTSVVKTDDQSKASADRFLKLLVTQLQNQDPLNPMDNAQITSQMAQINAVTGLERVNESVRGLSAQMLRTQAMQGAALVGHDVMVEGAQLAVRDGIGRGAVELAGTAQATVVEVLDGAGQVAGTIELGNRQPGVHSFEWPLGNRPADGQYSFRVAAFHSGAGVPARTLELQRVQSVSTAGDSLSLNFANNRSVGIADVVAFN